MTGHTGGPTALAIQSLVTNTQLLQNLSGRQDRVLACMATLLRLGRSCCGIMEPPRKNVGMESMVSGRLTEPPLPGTSTPVWPSYLHQPDIWLKSVLAEQDDNEKCGYM